jgi:hypothetical protein
MTPSALLEKPADRIVEADGSAAVADPADQTEIKLGGLRTTSANGAATHTRQQEKSQPAAALEPERPDVPASIIKGWKAASSPGDLEGNKGATITFSSRTNSTNERSELSSSLDALSRIANAQNKDAVAWLETASVLKRDAIRLRSSSIYGRHASVLLTVADALTHTEPDDPTLHLTTCPVLREALALLTEPFVKGDDEKRLVRDLLAGGWNLAPAYEDAL